MIEIIENIKAAKGRNAKIEILQSLDEEQVKLFKRVAWLCYDPSIDYYIKAYETADEHIGCISLEDALNDLQNIIASRAITGNMAKAWIKDMHGMLSEDDAAVFCKVIDRDLGCGISAKTVNKVFPNTVYIHPYSRCSGFSEKNLSRIEYPCYSQTKMDGLYCDVMVYTPEGKDEPVVEYRSRNGSYLKLGNEDRDKLLIEQADGYVVMGEALVVDEEGNLMDRQSSNGYLNSDDIDPDRIYFYAWNLVPIDDFNAKKSDVKYSESLEQLYNVADNVDFIKVVSTRNCHTKQDILDHFKEMRLAGNEGTVIKNKAMKWKDGDSKDQIKCKVIFDCDLIAKEWKYGEGKHTGLVGSIRFESADGLLSVWVGGGFKDAQRRDYLETIDSKIEAGMVAKIRGNDVISNRDNPDLYSIFLPRFVEERIDKDVADDLESIKEQVKSFTDALDQIKK